jgi:shikimate dehydrogenase
MDKYGLIGYPLGHSFSISYFNQKFADEGINAKYENYEIANIDMLPEILDKNPELRGLNVTIPYKEKVIPFLDAISPEARAIGAVNVIRVSHEKNKILLKGYNSDIIGFTQSIEPMIDKKWHKKALILGTGGASKAINYGLKSLGLETVFVSRYQRPGTIQYEQITPEVVGEYNVIVNCTPLGMYPHTDECPLLPYEAMDYHTILYDLIYNPEKTLFLQKGEAQGATIKNGMEMLHGQAVAAWKIWTGQDY